MMTHTIEAYADKAGQWRWRLKRKRGGKIIADGGEGYGRLHDLKRAVKRLPVNWSRIEVMFP